MTFIRKEMYSEVTCLKYKGHTAVPSYGGTHRASRVLLRSFLTPGSVRGASLRTHWLLSLPLPELRAGVASVRVQGQPDVGGK